MAGHKEGVEGFNYKQMGANQLSDPGDNGTINLEGKDDAYCLVGDDVDVILPTAPVGVRVTISTTPGAAVGATIKDGAAATIAVIAITELALCYSLGNGNWAAVVLKKNVS